MEANGGKWTQMEHPSTIGSRGDDPGRLKNQGKLLGNVKTWRLTNLNIRIIYNCSAWLKIILFFKFVNS